MSEETRMNSTENLAVLTAMDKAVRSRAKEVRVEADEGLMAIYEDMGVEKVELRVADVPVGTLQVTYAAEGYEVTDLAAFAEFGLANGMAREKKAIRPEYMDAAIKIVEAHLPEAVEATVEPAKDLGRMLDHVGDAVVAYGTSEVVPGVSYRPKRAKGTMVRGCEPEKVIPLLASLPGGVEPLLLGGGADA